MQQEQDQKELMDAEMEFEEAEAPEPKHAANPKPLTEDNLSKLGGSKAGSATKS